MTDVTIEEGEETTVRVRNPEPCREGPVPANWWNMVPWCAEHRRPVAVCSLERFVAELEGRVEALERRA